MQSHVCWGQDIKPSEVVFPSLLVFELRACILRLLLLRNTRQLQKNSVGHPRHGESFKASWERGREDTQEWTDSAVCEEHRLTFPKFNSHSPLGICAQPASTKATCCTYKVGASCVWCTNARRPTQSSRALLYTFIAFPTILCKLHIVQLCVCLCVSVGLMQHFLPPLFLNLPRAVSLSHRSIPN